MAIRIFLVLLLATLVRIFALGSNPAGVFHDEAEKGYSAFSLLRIGGTLDFTRPVQIADYVTVPSFHRWPIFVDVWGSLTSMIYQYADLPFVAALGLNPWSLRLPAAIAGILTVLLTYFLARSLTGSNRIAFWAMALLTLSPWHVIFSRWAQQGIFVPLFLSAGLLGLLRARGGAGCQPANLGGDGFSDSDTTSRPPGAMTNTNSPHLAGASCQPAPLCLAAAFCLGLAFYAYSGAQPFLLLFYPALAWFWRKEIWRNKGASSLALLLLISLIAPTLYATFGHGGMGAGRLQRLSIFQMDETASYKVFLFFKNYLAHFSPQFLFISGDTLDRHGLRGFGVMLQIEILFLIAGIYTALRRRSFGDKILLTWFFLFPVSAAITNEGIPHALRTLHAIPCPQILSAIGFAGLLQWLKSKWGAAGERLMVCAVAANACLFIVALFIYYPHYSAPLFEYGARQSIRSAQSSGEPKSSNYHIFVPPESGLPLVPELFHFHAQTPPEQLLRQGIQSSHVQIIPSAGFDGENFLQMLQPGDSILLSPRFAAQMNTKSLSVDTIYWHPHPFRKDALATIAVITRK